MRERPSKLILIAVDGLSPEMLDRLVAEDACPSLAGIIERGALSRLWPVPPVDGPANWTSLATGAWPGTHGCTAYGIHVSGEAFDAVHDVTRNVFPSFANDRDAALNEMCQAEYLWQAAARAGKRSILINFPGAWPPNCESAIVVDGSGPYSSPLARLSYPNLFSTLQRTSDQSVNKLRTAKPHGWREPPQSARRPIELAFVLTGEANLEPTMLGWMVVDAQPGQARRREEFVLYTGLVTASSEKAYDTLIICAKDKNAAAPLATLRVGEWSEWLDEEFDTPYGPVRGRFKLHLAQLSGDGHDLQLYRTTIFNTSGWTQPESLAYELVDRLVQQAAALPEPRDGTKESEPRIAPLCQVRESAADQAEAIASVCEHVAAADEWDLLLVHTNVFGGLNSAALNALWPGSSRYELDRASETWARFCKQMAEADAMIGRVVRVGGEDALVAVVSVHSAVPSAKRVWLGKWLVDAGLCAYARTPDGRMTLDWTCSKVVLGDGLMAHHIWINLKGRDPQGIVEPGAEFERVRDEVIRALYGIRDPHTGECPVHLALGKDDAEFIGQWGDRVGDVVYLLTPGYADDPRVHSGGAIDPSLLPADGMAPLTSGPQGAHAAHAPWARLGGFSVSGLMAVTGPCVRRGYRRPRPTWVVDAAPSLAHAIGLPPPRNAEGTVVADLLQE